MGQFDLETNPYQILSLYLRNVDNKPTEKITIRKINVMLTEILFKRH